MRMRPGPLLLALLVLAAAPVLGQGSTLTPAQEAAVQAQVNLLVTWGRDAELVRAVAAQNGLQVGSDKVQQTDARWVAGEAEELVRGLESNACARRLKELISGHAAYREGLVMDDQGALVCITHRTSDYWQGDEPKWQKAYNGGSGQIFVDRARYDTSAHAILVQVSVPVKNGERTIGALTVGLEPAQLVP